MIGRLFAALAAGAICAAAAAAAEPPLRLRIVGGLANLNPYTQHEEPFWTRELPRLANGRVQAEIVPFDRAGIRGPEMLRLVRLGSVPFGTALLTLSAAQDPELAAPDLAGLNPDLPSLQRSVGAFRPYLERLLHERFDARLLALYLYPAQVTFCSRPLSGLDDLAGRRVRVSSASQADLMQALGAIPVHTAFADIGAHLRNGSVECAVTGTMSGHLVGLHELTGHLHTLPISWGLAAFVANRQAFGALPAELRELLLRELPRLERALWDAAARETDEGIACNVGAAGCRSGRPGRMVMVRPTPADERRRREALLNAVLPRWVERCGSSCAELWSKTIGPATGIAINP